MSRQIVGDILDKIEEIHESMPDLTIGFILQAAIDTSKAQKNVPLSDISEKVLLSSLEKFELRELRKRGK